PRPSSALTRASSCSWSSEAPRQASRPERPREKRRFSVRFRAPREGWPPPCSTAGEIQERRLMTVPARYILAALAFGVAALGLLLLPTEASADCGASQCRRPPSCQHGCALPPPPPSNCCQPPVVVVPPPHVPPPNIVVVNAGARASAHASATAIAIANVEQGDTIIRQNSFATSGAAASVTSAAFAVTEGATTMERIARERELLIQAICIDASNNPHPASQTFGGRDVADGYRGEIYRCMSGTRMRDTVDGQSYERRLEERRVG